MNLYLISQDKNVEYDTYDSAVIAATNTEEARMTHPGRRKWDGKEDIYGDWTAAENVKVELLGTATIRTKSGVICASFNAG